MNAYDIVICAFFLYLAVRMLEEENPGYWVPLGALVGLGMTMKYSKVLFGIALVLGLLVTPSRHLLWNRWFVWGVLCWGLFLLPNAIWQFLHGFPPLEFYRNAMGNKNIAKSAVRFLSGRVLFANPVAFPLWITGVVFLFVSNRMAKYSSLGWMYGALLLVMILSRSSHPDRIAAIDPVLLAGGAVAIQSVGQQILRRGLNGIMVVMLIAGSVFAAPPFTSLLSPQATSRMIP
jgi:4-amino-4-deoxy-L-arabinose transferase-like glycosyltransferase